MDFLLMALGHNFRKMITYGILYLKITFKIINTRLKRTFKIEIFSFTTSTNQKNHKSHPKSKYL